MRKYNVIVAPYAFILLERHVAFLAQVSEPGARKLETAILQGLETLQTNAESYPLWLPPEFTPPKPYRKVVITKNHFILHFVDGNDVFVDYILDVRMDNIGTLF